MVESSNMMAAVAIMAARNQVRPGRRVIAARKPRTMVDDLTTVTVEAGTLGLTYRAGPATATALRCRRE
jgi:hypothetical protein